MLGRDKMKKYRVVPKFQDWWKIEYQSGWFFGPIWYPVPDYYFGPYFGTPERTNMFSSRGAAEFAVQQLRAYESKERAQKEKEAEFYKNNPPYIPK